MPVIHSGLPPILLLTGLVSAEGQKAEAAYAKVKTLPDPESTDNPEFKIVLSIIKEGLDKEPQKWTNMAKDLRGNIRLSYRWRLLCSAMHLRATDYPCWRQQMQTTVDSWHTCCHIIPLSACCVGICVSDITVLSCNVLDSQFNFSSQLSVLLRCMHWPCSI